MKLNDGDYVSLNDFLHECCHDAGRRSSVVSLGDHVISVIYRQQLLRGVLVYKAEAADKTRHLLLRLDVILAAFQDDALSAKLQRPDTTDTTHVPGALEALLGRTYVTTDSFRDRPCSKVRKLFIQTESFSAFVRRGPVDLAKFNDIRHRLKYVVCLDIEAYERDHSKILEVGLAIYELDKRQIINEHIIIEEHRHFRNGRYIADNRDRFNFGRSAHMSLKAALRRILDHLAVSDTCLLGHNINADLQYLRSCSVKNIDVPVFDTQTIYKQLKSDDNPTGLSRLLEELSITHTHLHNAGNDAHYTLMAFLSIAKLGETTSE